MSRQPISHPRVQPFSPRRAPTRPRIPSNAEPVQNGSCFSIGSRRGCHRCRSGPAMIELMDHLGFVERDVARGLALCRVVLRPGQAAGFRSVGCPSIRASAAAAALHALPGANPTAAVADEPGCAASGRPSGTTRCGRWPCETWPHEDDTPHGRRTGTLRPSSISTGTRAQIFAVSLSVGRRYGKPVPCRCSD